MPIHQYIQLNEDKKTIFQTFNGDFINSSEGTFWLSVLSMQKGKR